MKILFLLFLAASAALVCRATDGGKRAEDVVKKDTGTEFVSEGISMLEKIRVSYSSKLIVNIHSASFSHMVFLN